MWALLPFASSPEHRLPLIQFLFIGSRVCYTLLSDLASRLGPCASLSLHVHHGLTPPSYRSFSAHKGERPGARLQAALKPLSPEKIRGDRLHLYENDNKQKQH